ncbi:MAG: ribonuclease R [Phycisphaerae bacterium]
MTKSKKQTEPPFVKDVLAYLRENPRKPTKIKALAKALGISERDYPKFRDTVHDMIDDGTLFVGRGQTMRLPEARDELEGIFRATRSGVGFLEVEGRPDLFIQRHDVNDALDGDKVVAELTSSNRHDREPRARILRVLERSPYNWTGVVQKRGEAWFVQPAGKTHARAIHIEDPTAKSVKVGDLVVVEPLEIGGRHGFSRGVVIERLGQPSETGALMLSVMRRYELPEAFPASVRTAARRVIKSFDPEDKTGRDDLTKMLTITIDPVDARDFDDAITLEKLDHGRMRLGVHIADVAHFVKAGGALDREAYERGTSVYLPRRVVPMLPEVLSNGVCSLQPDENRYALSAFITYSSQAKVEKTWFARSVIRSDIRMTYEQVTAVFDGLKSDLPQNILDMLDDAQRLAKRIQARRIRDGMVTLEMDSPDLVLDENDRVIDIVREDTSFSHKLIEMFMVETNEAVSRFLTKRNVPHLRRIHPAPPADASDNLTLIENALGMHFGNDLDRGTMGKILEQAADKPEQGAVSLLLLRSMAQAYYGPGKMGHFALASDAYSHFTSPIRRYPDLVTHRALIAQIEEKSKQGKKKDGGPGEVELAGIGWHASRRERLAQKAEREAKTMLILRFLQDKTEEVFRGTVLSVEKYGVFMQIRPFLAEGLLPFSAIGGGRWQPDVNRGVVEDSHTGRVIRIGSSFDVRIATIDPPNLVMELEAVSPHEIGTKMKTKKGSKNKPRRGGFRDTKRSKQKRGHRRK